MHMQIVNSRGGSYCVDEASCLAHTGGCESHSAHYVYTTCQSLFPMGISMCNNGFNGVFVETTKSLAKILLTWANFHATQKWPN